MLFENVRICYRDKNAHEKVGKLCFEATKLNGFFFEIRSRGAYRHAGGH